MQGALPERHCWLTDLAISQEVPLAFFHLDLLRAQHCFACSGSEFFDLC